MEQLPVDRYTHHRVQHTLLESDADAAVGVVTNGLELQREQGRVAHELPIGGHPPVYGMAIVPSPSFADGTHETVRSFLRATARGWAGATEDPEEAVDALVSRNATLERDRAIEREKFEAAATDLQFTDHVREAGWGHHDPDRWARLGDALARNDLLDGPVDPAFAWTNEFVDADAPVVRNYADRIGRHP